MFGCKHFESLRRIRAIANYQFGKDVGRDLFPDDVKITYSKRTGRIRHIYLGDSLIATLRPKDGLISLTIEGARRLMRALQPICFHVVVSDDVAKFIAEGRDVFSRHVVEADPMLRAGDEALVLTRKGDLLAVGKTLLTGKEMLAFKRGIAVKVRWGVAEKNAANKSAPGKADDAEHGYEG
jgi:uncharacterized protein with predicted RNA binding PUA domain